MRKIQPFNILDLFKDDEFKKFNEEKQFDVFSNKVLKYFPYYISLQNSEESYFFDYNEKNIKILFEQIKQDLVLSIETHYPCYYAKSKVFDDIEYYFIKQKKQYSIFVYVKSLNKDLAIVC